MQGYLQSREAMNRLDADAGFHTHFQGEKLDPIQRLDDDATSEDAYKLYKKNVLISYDPTEGIIKMEVIAPDPAVSAQWAQQLIDYAEERIDNLSKQKRDDTMAGAQKNYAEAEQAGDRGAAPRDRPAGKVQGPELGSRGRPADHPDRRAGNPADAGTPQPCPDEANENPNQARMEPVKRRIATLEEQIAILRSKLTEGEAGGESLARIQGELMVAQAEVQTRQMVLATSLQPWRTAGSRPTVRSATFPCPWRPPRPMNPPIPAPSRIPS